MAYPVPFATADDVVRIGVEAEQLGYHEVAGNDHLSTQRFVREAWPAAPVYFEPLMMLATIAAKTSVVRLGTGILVLPMRDPVLLAKQVATLDHISGGRVTLAVAVGGYRDEFEAVVPDLADANRTHLMAEGIEALRVLFEKPRSTYEGKYRPTVTGQAVGRGLGRCHVGQAVNEGRPFPHDGIEGGQQSDVGPLVRGDQSDSVHERTAHRRRRPQAGPGRPPERSVRRQTIRSRRL